jgi:uncharacterized membrane protein
MLSIALFFYGVRYEGTLFIIGIIFGYLPPRRRDWLISFYFGWAYTSYVVATLGNGSEST